MTNYLMQRAADILLVASNLDELKQVRHALQRARIENRLHHVGDAVEAKAYLRREGPYIDAPTPGLVLLDADLPRDSVMDLVTELKTSAKFAGIAVSLMARPDSDCRADDDCIQSSDGIINKPVNPCELLQVLFSVDALQSLVPQTVSAR